MSVGQGNFQYGSSVKISGDICFDIETTGLDPLKDRITAIGICNGFCTDAIVDKDEKHILERFWVGLRRKYPYVRLIGFNCWSFDMPFLIIRSFKHNVRLLDVRGKVIDIRHLLSHGNRYQKGKLEEYARLVGLELKYNGYTGLDAIRLWNENKLDELREYVLVDAKITHQLYERIKEIGLIK